MKIPILITLLAVLAAPVSAQGLETFLNSEAGYISYEVTIVPPEIIEENQGFFSRISNFFSFLGIRYTTIEQLPIGTKITVASTGYASSPYQTDSTPCVTAAGTRVRPGTVASNFLPLGTLLEIFGDEFIVEDRMSRRFARRLDIWFPKTSDALTHGVRDIEVTVTGYGEPGDPIRQEAVVVAPKLTPWQRVKEGFSSLGRFLTTRSDPDVNRFDIDCLSAES